MYYLRYLHISINLWLMKILKGMGKEILFCLSLLLFRLSFCLMPKIADSFSDVHMTDVSSAPCSGHQHGYLVCSRPSWTLPKWWNTGQEICSCAYRAGPWDTRLLCALAFLLDLSSSLYCLLLYLESSSKKHLNFPNPSYTDFLSRLTLPPQKWETQFCQRASGKDWKWGSWVGWDFYLRVL